LERIFAQTLSADRSSRSGLHPYRRQAKMDQMVALPWDKQRHVQLPRGISRSSQAVEQARTGMPNEAINIIATPVANLRRLCEVSHLKTVGFLFLVFASQRGFQPIAGPPLWDTAGSLGCTGVYDLAVFFNKHMRGAARRLGGAGHRRSGRARAARNNRFLVDYFQPRISLGYRAYYSAAISIS
jgi:hypothetical protein